MRFRDGTVLERALFAVLVGLYALGLIIAAQDKFERVGHPDVGWVMDGAEVSPMRADAAAAGLRGGGRAITLNGVDLRTVRGMRHVMAALVHRGLGDSNTLTIQGSGGVVHAVTIAVRPWQWRDVLFAEGPTLGLGAFFVLVGIGSFLLRPFDAGSWALLALCSAAGGILTSKMLEIGPNDTLKTLYFRAMVGFISVSPFHAALAFPVVHPLLLRRPRIVVWIYAAAITLAALQFAGWYTDWAGPLRYFGGGLDTTVFLVAVLVFTGRFMLSMRNRNALVAQRARIVFAGALFGVVPLVVVNFLRTMFDIVLVDMRTIYWTTSLFLLALVYLTVRHDLLNARIAVRRAVIYAAVVGILTVVAILLIALRPYAVAVLLLPLLYWWPRFDARLNAWLYPQRARFPELVRSLGNEFAGCSTADAVLDVLVSAPARLCDARNSLAFMFGGGGGATDRVRAGGSPLGAGRPLADEVLVQLLVTTRKDLWRDRLAGEPQYSNIKDDCIACFSRLGAEVLLPIVVDTRVIGGLAIGPRATGDVYEGPELDALSTVAQQAAEALVRIAATERLRARELEFAELKRFFPPQIIDQVMAHGGAAELRSQRRLVTVLFADLRGFTSFSDSVEPEEVMATLAEYHAAMGERIAEFGGTLERFVGDGFMVFFNDPIEQPDHVQRAARMALAMLADVGRLHAEWTRKGYQIDVGMGLDSGYATCGFIGYEGRRDYGVIGNVTNLAARLSGAAAGGEIVISARVQAELHNGFRAESIGDLTLKGFHQAQPAYRLLAGHTKG